MLLLLSIKYIDDIINTFDYFIYKQNIKSLHIKNDLLNVEGEKT